MSTYVIDTSTAFKWAVAEVDSDKALALRNDCAAGLLELLAPDLFPTEIANSLLIAERRGRIKPGEWPVFFNDIMLYCPDLRDAGPHLPRAYEIATLLQATIYDSLYVALAEFENCEFVTADDKLVRKAHPHFPFVIRLSNMPTKSP
jgi:predicted nucleic acid-binding protein